MSNDSPAPQQVSETYEMRCPDRELHCMDVLAEALRRHVLPQGTRTVSDEDMEPARRVVRWLAARIGA